MQFVQQGFKKNERLPSHMNSHKCKQDKYTCSDCGKQFTTKSNLNHHQIIHTDNREKCLCDLCQKTFSSKGNLGRHIEGVHNRTAHKILLRAITNMSMSNPYEMLFSRYKVIYIIYI